MEKDFVNNLFDNAFVNYGENISGDARVRAQSWLATIRNVRTFLLSSNEDIFIPELSL